jgi:hypothetical protein
VAGRLDHTLRKAKPAYRLNLLYVISAVLRGAHAIAGHKSKLVKRMEPMMPAIFKALSQTPEEDVVLYPFSKVPQFLKTSN